MFNEIHGLAGVYFLLLLMLAHFVGDFVLQSRWMAENKSRSLRALLLHGGVYSVVLLLFYFIFTLLGLLNQWQAVLITYDLLVGWGWDAAWVQDFCLGKGFLFQIWLVFVVVSGLFHIGVDFITSKLTSHFWQRKNMQGFWVVIGFDQWLHFACLLWVAHKLGLVWVLG